MRRCMEKRKRGREEVKWRGAKDAKSGQDASQKAGSPFLLPNFSLLSDDDEP